MKPIFEQLGITDDRLGHRMEHYHIPRFQVNGLNNFQRMLKCLLECFAKPLNRETIYTDVANYIQMRLALPVTPFTVLICTNEDIERLGAIRREGSVLLEFAMVYAQEFEEMADGPFLERLMDIDDFDDIDPPVTPTVEQAIEYSWMWQWQPRRASLACNCHKNQIGLPHGDFVSSKHDTFGRFHLVLERLKDGDNPRTMAINKLDIWVQLHGMTAGFMSQRVVKDVGNYIDIPVKRRMKLKKSEENWCWVNFKYEAIPTFCFFCGIIGHGEKFCNKMFDLPEGSIERPYGAWLHAEPKRKMHTMGARWLRNPGSAQSMYTGDGGGVGSVKMDVVIGGSSQQTSMKQGDRMDMVEIENADFQGGNTSDKVDLKKGGIKGGIKSLIAINVEKNQFLNNQFLQHITQCEKLSFIFLSETISNQKKWKNGVQS
ncbi:hypothetical protein AgCh_023700 [Apium graveolens]